MKKVTLILLFVLVALSACAPKSAETVAVQNANPVTVAEANALNTKALADYEDRAFSRFLMMMRATQPDYSWLVAAGFAFSFVLAPLALGAYMLYRMMRGKQSGNVYNIVVMHQTPRGRWVQANNGSHVLETGQDVTDIIRAVTRQEVTK